MTLEAFGSAELGIHAEGGGAYGKPSSTSDDIVNSPALSGTYSFKVDPVNGNGLDAYGWSAGIEPATLPSNSNFFLISFIFRLEGNTFDANVAIAEISDGNASGVTSRFIALDNNQAIKIFDKDDDEVGTTSDNYIAVDTTYYFLWLYDQRDTSATRDALWIYQTSWDAAIPMIRGHGDGSQGAATNFISFGSRVGKGSLPTVGGPFYVDDMCVQDLGHSPNAQPLASVTVKVKMPTSNGTDGDFNAGSGAGSHPDWQLVDEIPGDEITTYDEGDVDEDFQSYNVANADSGDDVLAVQVVGQQRRTGSGTTLLRPFVHDGTSRDQVGEPIVSTTTWRRFRPNVERESIAENQINGVNLSETLFNTLEAGVRIQALAASDAVQLSQIALEYAIPGPRELPQDFPILSAGVALGSGNMGII